MNENHSTLTPEQKDILQPIIDQLNAIGMLSNFTMNGFPGGIRLESPLPLSALLVQKKPTEPESREVVLELLGMLEMDLESLASLVGAARAELSPGEQREEASYGQTVDEDGKLIRYHPRPQRDSE